MSNMRYYLRIRGEIIDLSDIFGEEIKDLLTLSLFTSLFDDTKDLLYALKSMGKIDKVLFPYEIQIIEKTSRMSSDIFSVVSEDTLLKKDRFFLNPFNIERFFEYNKKNTLALTAFFEDYLYELDGLILTFQSKIERMQNNLKHCIDKQIKSAEKSLSKFRYKRSQIKRLLTIIRDFGNQNCYFSSELEKEYINIISWFINSETSYMRRGIKTKNNRGLVRLALNCRKLVEKFPDLKIPFGMDNYSKLRHTLLLKLKKRILLEEERAKQTKTIYNEAQSSEEDPDNFMFLEIEDYDSLYLDSYKRERSTSEDESVEDAIANLEEQKKKYGK